MKPIMYVRVVNFSMLFQNLNSLERDETHHVCSSYNLYITLFFFSLHVTETEKQIYFNPSLQKLFFFACTKKLLQWPYT
jgi:hypothetical protein